MRGATKFATRPAFAALAALVSVVALATSSGCKSEPGPRLGERAPDFVLPRLDGTVQKLSNYRGRVVLVNLWATWCPPCIEEMPLLNDLATDYSERGLAVLGIAGDEDPQAVEKFVHERPLQFDVLLDPRGAVGTEYGITGYPETFLIDREGRLLAKFVGPLPSASGRPSPELLQAVDKALGSG